MYTKETAIVCMVGWPLSEDRLVGTRKGTLTETPDSTVILPVSMWYT